MYKLLLMKQKYRLWRILLYFIVSACTFFVSFQPLQLVNIYTKNLFETSASNDQRFLFRSPGNTSICDNKPNQTLYLALIISAIPYSVKRTRMRLRLNSQIRDLRLKNIYRDYVFKYQFVLGIDIKNNTEQEEQIRKEQEMNGDIIQGKFKDIYSELAMKSLYSLYWASHYCQSASYVIKVDDDVYFNIKNIYNNAEPKFSNEKWVMGHEVKEASAIRERDSKYFVPFSYYPEAKYPNYVSGFCYIMTFRAATAIVKASMEVQGYKFEDVYINGMCREKANVSLIHNDDFCYKRIKQSSCIAFHRIDRKEEMIYRRH